MMSSTSMALVCACVVLVSGVYFVNGDSFTPLGHVGSADNTFTPLGSIGSVLNEKQPEVTNGFGVHTEFSNSHSDDSSEEDEKGGGGGGGAGIWGLDGKKGMHGGLFNAAGDINWALLGIDDYNLLGHSNDADLWMLYALGSALGSGGGSGGSGGGEGEEGEAAGHAGLGAGLAGGSWGHGGASGANLWALLRGLHGHRSGQGAGGLGQGSASWGQSGSGFGLGSGSLGYGTGGFGYESGRWGQGTGGLGLGSGSGSWGQGTGGSSLGSGSWGQGSGWATGQTGIGATGSSTSGVKHQGGYYNEANKADWDADFAHFIANFGYNSGGGSSGPVVDSLVKFMLGEGRGGNGSSGSKGITGDSNGGSRASQNAGAGGGVSWESLAALYGLGSGRGGGAGGGASSKWTEAEWSAYLSRNGFNTGANGGSGTGVTGIVGNGGSGTNGGSAGGIRGSSGTGIGSGSGSGSGSGIGGGSGGGSVNGGGISGSGGISGGSGTGTGGGSGGIGGGIWGAGGFGTGSGLENGGNGGGISSNVHGMGGISDLHWLDTAMMMPGFWETELGEFLAKYWYLLLGRQQPGQPTPQGEMSRAEMEALINRLKAMIKEARMRAYWEKYNRNQTTARKGFVSRSKPGHVLQTVQGTMGSNKAGGNSRFVLGTSGGTRVVNVNTGTTRSPQTVEVVPVPVEISARSMRTN
ncbi:uncharacterized protein LOC127855975 [Dreissena polymorpha]|nr:uncharacterized protein LOC127855975 [Dreissena polymorpha]